jgi:poly(3-hydroxybutyrate) depolymerase
VVVPEGRRDKDGSRGWNAGFRMNRWGSSPPDDIGFLNNLVDSVISTNRNIDRSKIFIVGFSNGGFMTNQLVCFNASRYAGIVNVVGSAPRDVASCKPGTAVSVLHTRGTSDDIVLYDGTVGVPSPHFDGSKPERPSTNVPIKAQSLVKTLSVKSEKACMAHPLFTKVVQKV